jgi:hypothetical protein
MPETLRRSRAARDFAFLRAHSVWQLRHLACEVWTDCNAHDLDIAIHEQLCFVLTGAAPLRTAAEIIGDERYLKVKIDMSGQGDPIYSREIGTYDLDVRLPARAEGSHGYQDI